MGIKNLIFVIGLSLNIFLISCGQAGTSTVTGQSAVQASGQSNGQVSGSLSMTSITNPLTHLEVNYFAGGSTVNFKHQSGDSIFVNYTVGITDSDTNGMGSFLGFIVNNGDATNAQTISLVNLDTGNIVSTTPCLGDVGFECYDRIAAEPPWFTQMTCTKGGQNYFVPSPGNYQIQITYSDGTKRLSTIVFQDPCTSTNVVKGEEKTRSIASVSSTAIIENEAESSRQVVKLYLSILTLAVFSAILYFFYRRGLGQ